MREPDALHAEGRIRRRAGDLPGAVALWEEALALDPGHAGSLADLGTASLVRGDTTAALGYLERAVAADPRLASAWFDLALIQLDRERTALALEALRRFLDVAGPEHADQVRWAEGMVARLSGIR